jgi:hypothetical protein
VLNDLPAFSVATTPLISHKIDGTSVLKMDSIGYNTLQLFFKSIVALGFRVQNATRDLHHENIPHKNLRVSSTKKINKDTDNFFVTVVWLIINTTFLMH